VLSEEVFVARIKIWAANSDQRHILNCFKTYDPFYF